MDLFEAADEAARVRDHAAQAALDASHTSWRVAAEAALLELAATGAPFTVEELRDRVGQLGGHANALGGLFIKQRKAGLIEQAGWRTSRRPEARQRGLRVWRGTPKARELAEPPRVESVADQPAPCVQCHRPAYLRDQHNAPRHQGCTGVAA